ncbi:tyrosine-type recombinase/integrase [Dictyobacter formicarum]|uniref:Tyrosine recombinase XerC n=1 Tax=Dictyobacter formicarum TaxID=2778368 RepID=A0ABQ3VUU5_9CHLR|nr:tyrosine-type recombinase/integrase [Dictyobacter formicarum]GHO89526.1 tyrosine recombinase XerC [Dictyobacter formicarum]
MHTHTTERYATNSMKVRTGALTHVRDEEGDWDEQDRSAAYTDDRIALFIEEWLLDKYALTQSKCTEATYRDIVLSLRQHLQERELDLDSAAEEVALVIPLWASLRASGSKRQGSVAPSTYNQRIAAVSSFYRWMIERDIYSGANPAEQLARASVQKYAHARALNPQHVSMRLRSIDRSTPRGLRDYMLLQIALNTGRSAQELASLSWRHVHVDGENIVLVFERCKGGKTLYNPLDVQLSKALLTYLCTIYGERLDLLGPSTPLWMSFSDRTYGQAIGSQTIADICENHLGVSSVHTLRHTFALTMEQLGAETSTIQGQLGHESLAATNRYLAKLKRAYNPHASALADVFGVEEVVRS